jgi:UrcA family protein
MTYFMNTLASVASVALALTSLSVMPSRAQAAEVRVEVADLDLSTPADAARFLHRVNVAADRVCGSARQSLQARAACRTGIREEAIEKLGFVQRANLQVALAGGALKQNMQLAGY